MIRLLPGDCRAILPTLDAGSVHCVVTSPPYYGLRDYGTAQWDGGDATCDHSMAIRAGDPVPPACRRCQKCRKMCRTQWTSATSVRSECDQCGVATDYNDVDSRGTSWGVVRKTGHADTGDLVWALPHQRYPGDICRCGARRIDRQIGLEATAEEWIAELVGVFREVRRVLRDDGTCWVNCGDAFRDKQLLMMPARLALALQADGWWLRSQIVWAKPNPMPESVTDRPTSAYEMVYLLSKRSRYFFDMDAVREPLSDKTYRTFGCEHRPQGNDALGNVKSDNWGSSLAIHKPKLNGAGEIAGRSLRNVWTIAPAPFSAAHFATYPPELVERCIRAGTSERGCCAQCGAPWVRQMQHPDFSQQPKRQTGKMTDLRNGDRTSAGQAWQEWRNANPSHTTGWQPGCTHGADVVPCTVLDPFAGAGTTLLVADRLQRNAVGIELNAAYTEMAMERVKRDAPLFADLASAQDPTPEPSPADLFSWMDAAQ